MYVYSEHLVLSVPVLLVSLLVSLVNVFHISTSFKTLRLLLVVVVDTTEDSTMVKATVKIINVEIGDYVTDTLLNKSLKRSKRLHKNETTNFLWHKGEAAIK